MAKIPSRPIEELVEMAREFCDRHAPKQVMYLRAEIASLLQSAAEGAEKERDSWKHEFEEARSDASKYAENVIAMARERDSALKDAEDQARLNGMGSQREARLMAERDSAIARAVRAEGALESLSMAAAHATDTYAPHEPLSRPLMDKAHESLRSEVAKAREALARGEGEKVNTPEGEVPANLGVWDPTGRHPSVTVGADPRGGSLPLPQAKCEAVGMGSTPTAPTTTPAPEGFEEHSIGETVDEALFQEWHRRECPDPGECKMYPDIPWTGGWGVRWDGRTCREVYEQEHPAPTAHGREEGLEEAIQAAQNEPADSRLPEREWVAEQRMRERITNRIRALRGKGRG